MGDLEMDERVAIFNLLKELVERVLINNLEIRIDRPDSRLEVSLMLFGEQISSSSIYR